MLADPGTALVHPAARRLLAEVTAEPAAPLRLAITAPGGYGKTTLLTALDGCYRRAGIDALLVDDAHLLTPGRLEAAVEGANGPVVLSGRLAPPLPGLRPLMLAPLGRDDLRRFAEIVSGQPVDDATAAELHVRSGGVPRLAERALAGRLADFRAELAELDDDVLRYLIAAEAGAGRNLDLLCALLDRKSERLPEIVDGARATGLLGPDDTLLPLAADAVRGYGPPARRLTTLQRLVELQLAQGLPVLDLARSLLNTGSSGATAATAFAAAAREALPDNASLAAKFFEAAADAGDRGAGVTAGWARAAALAGDLDTALRLGDSMLGAEDARTRAAGAEIAATVLAHRGELARSAELYHWAGRGGADAFAATALVGTGDLDGAQRLLDSPAPGVAPTLFAGAAARMARGIAGSVSGGAAETLSTLLGAAAMLEPASDAVPLPDSPAALAALAGLHSGELALAESVLIRALDGRIGGDLLATRHRLLLGWVAMTRGDLATAAAHRDAVSRPLEARDELFHATLELGLARRASDLLGLQRAWDRAYQASMRQQTDLFSLLPLGELTIAAARAGAHAKLAPQLGRAHALLERLGNPPLWTVSLSWHELHASITLEDGASAKIHLENLLSHAHYGRYPAALAAAAQGWLAVLGGTFAPDEISAAAAELADLGLRWDAARLAGQAAIRTSDRRAMVQLLEAARQFQGTAGSRSPNTAEPAAAGAGLAALSERELEVARLVVDGLTYKQAGSKLFISGKTVEHHMARIRGKLGAADRRELLATLRELLSRADGEISAH